MKESDDETLERTTVIAAIMPFDPDMRSAPIADHSNIRSRKVADVNRTVNKRTLSSPRSKRNDI